MAIADTVLDPIIRDDLRDDIDVREAPLYRILIHNDDVTPFDYVIRTLRRIFMLSQELAEHVAETAHEEEVAIVMIRPRTEAEKLIGLARTHARADGYPLTFSMEPD
jgi:ATP-dependent Clp protease adaptor protein ClpS